MDLEAGRIQAVVSTEAKDRQGDLIRQDGWDLKNFMAHPVLLSSHDYMSLRSVIGEWESMEVKGKKLVGIAKYYIGQGNEEADWGFNLASKGRAAYSVGFLPDMSKAKELDSDNWMGSFEFNGQELLEVSQVSIPANPEALQHMKTLQLDPIISELITEQLTESGTLGMERPYVDLEVLSQSLAQHLIPILGLSQRKALDEMRTMLMTLSTKKIATKDLFSVEDLTSAIQRGMKGE